MKSRWEPMRTGCDMLVWCHVLLKFPESSGANYSDHERRQEERVFEKEGNLGEPESDGVNSEVIMLAGKIKLFPPPMQMGVSELI